MTEIKPFLDGIEFWHWWIFALFLIGAEALLPGVFFLWMGVAAAIIGVAVLVTPDLAWEIQWIAFAVISIASVVGWRAYLLRYPTQTDQPTLNRRGQDYVGRHLTLSQPLKDGHGRTKLDDSVWAVETEDGADLPQGTKVVVTALRDTVLIVRPAEVGPNPR